MADTTTTKPDLDLNHPSVLRTRPVRAVSRDLFAGEHAVKSMAQTVEAGKRKKSEFYLPKTKNESPNDYNRRLNLSVYDNYLEPVIQSRQGLIFKSDPKRTLPMDLKEWIDDVDKQGTTATIFFEGVAECAQVEGLIWVLVDMPEATEPAKGLKTPTRKQEQDAGLRPFIQLLSADAVIDFDVGDDRALLWAVVRQVRPEKPRKPGFKVESIEQRKIWRRDGWEVHEKDDAGEWVLAKHPDTGESWTGENPTGVIPLIPFYGVKVNEFEGLPITKDILGHCRAIYNKRSDLDWSLFMTNNPIYYTIGPRAPKEIEPGKGIHLFSEPDQQQPKIGYLEISGAGLEASRQSILDLIRRIFEIALFQAKRDGAQVQAADSQREDRAAFRASLKTVSRELEASETSVWKLWQKWEETTGTIEIEYIRDFDDAMIDAAMIKTLAELTTQELIPVADFLELLVRFEILPKDFDFKAAAQKLELQAELRGPQPSKEFMTQNSSAGTGGDDEDEIGKAA